MPQQGIHSRISSTTLRRSRSSRGLSVPNKEDNMRSLWKLHCVSTVVLGASRVLAADAAADLAAARATDPVALKWMVGFPPPPEKQIRFEDGSYYKFPQWRWTFSHWREVRPTVAVSRGSFPTLKLEK